MNLLYRRLVKLENRFPPRMPLDTVSEAQSMALQRLSMAELEVLRGMALRGDWENSLSEAEQSAVNSYEKALVAVATELQLPLTASESGGALV